MRFTDVTIRDAEDVLKELDAMPAGLGGAEAARRLERFGPNAVAASKTTWRTVLTRQLSSPFIGLLAAAATLSFLLGETFDGAMIVIFVAVNTGIGFYQEFKSEQTLRLLKKYFVIRTTVLRDGRETLIEGYAIVPGDVIVLKPGDVVPADARLFEEQELVMDESSLTGESVPVRKTSQVLSRGATETYAAENVVFSGTTVTGGKALAVVFATGRDAAQGDIGALVMETRRVSGFEKEISRFSKVILRLVLVTLAVVLVANVFIEGRHANIVELVIFSIALAVSIVPEALPIAMTFSLSRGALRLAKNKVAVKRLDAIEDLGGMEILCTDKTGTLTENTLTVAEILAPDDDEALRLAVLGAQQGSGRSRMPTNPFDLAVWRRLDAAGRKEIAKAVRRSETPFDPIHRCNSVVVGRKGGDILVVRGAAEVVFPRCTARDGRPPKEVSLWLAEQGIAGRRTLAVAWKPVRGTGDKAANDEQGLRFAGVISFVDPLKKDAAEAIRKAAALGVAVKILTGDAPEVAGAVAKKVGLVDHETLVLGGAEFEAMDAEAKHRAVDDFSVFARVSPRQKYEIVSLLRERHRVGFLGEGINDAPALKIADVALVVSDASDIARDAADIVLLKRGLMVVIDGVHEGRKVFANTTKYIRTTLASNFGNFYAVAVVSLFVSYLPLLPLQILLINLLTDLPMISIATDNVDARELKRPQAYDARGIVLVATVLGLVSTAFDFLFFSVFSHIRAGALQTNWFLGGVLTELVFLFSIRTRLPFFKATRPSAALVGASIVSAAAAIAAVTTPFGQRVFRFVAPHPRELLLIAVIVIAYFLVSERVKLLYYRGGKRSI